MSLNLCELCNHPHRGAIQCRLCDCDLTPLVITEDNMLKRIWKKIKFIFWKK